jgi:HTH-type transcriptional regulator / antitoxin HipB
MNKDLGEIIKYHRKQTGLTQEELAKLAGIGKTAVFDIENGKQTSRFQTIVKLLRILNIKLDWDSPLKLKYLKSKKL